jgi:hypothetical protein
MGYRQVLIAYLFITASLIGMGPLVALSTNKNGKQEATVEADCAPWDGPAYTIWVPAGKVGGKPNSWISISIWQAPDQSATSFTYPDLTGKGGHATYWPNLKSHEQVIWSKQSHENLAGKLYLTSINGHKSILGEFDFSTEKDVPLKGKFESRWSNKIAICG